MTQPAEQEDNEMIIMPVIIEPEIVPLAEEEINSFLEI